MTTIPTIRAGAVHHVREIDITHIRAALAIARKHESESQAWADVVTLLADLTIAD